MLTGTRAPEMSTCWFQGKLLHRLKRHKDLSKEYSIRGVVFGVTNSASD